jgi:hypothetical protein
MRAAQGGEKWCCGLGRRSIRDCASLKAVCVVESWTQRRSCRSQLSNPVTRRWPTYNELKFSISACE